MRVALDARFIGYAGIGRWVQGLWGGLIENGADVIGLWPAGPPRDWMGSQRPDPAGFHVDVATPPFMPQEQFIIPRITRRVGARVYHAPNWSVPYLTDRPVVLTVHDLYPYLDPTVARSRAAAAVYRTLVPLSVRKARRLVAVSPLAARQLVETFDVGEDRLRVVLHGIDHERFYPPSYEEVVDVRSRFSLPSTYLLYVGTLKPHKNLRTLLAAHSAEHPPLVLAGPTRDEFDASDLANLSRGAVLPIGRVQGELAALYGGAMALALPSLYESAPFPPLEAMACGTAVVCSDGGGLPEEVEDAGLVVPARDVAAWREALTQVAGDDELRSRLSNAGLAIAASRSWRRAASEYAEIYDEAIQ